MKLEEVRFNEVMEECKKTIDGIAITMDLLSVICKKVKAFNNYVDSQGIGHINNKKYWYDVSSVKNNIIKVTKEDAYNNREFTYYRVL